VSAEGKKMHSYASHNLKKATELAVELLGQGHSLALLTDRGTPGISDPGALLVEAARKNGVRVIPIPGASALAALVSVSGLSESAFFFAGFLPRENKPRSELFKKVGDWGVAFCFYEYPRGIRESVGYLKEAFPEGEVFFGREMTKLHEDYGWRALKDTNPEEFPEQGEYAVLVRPGKLEKAEAWEEEVNLRMASDRDWSKVVAARHGITSRDVYNALQRLREPK